MTNEELGLLFKIVGSIITILLLIFGFFLKSFYSEVKDGFKSLTLDIKSIREELQKGLLLIGVHTNDITTIKAHDEYVNAKLLDNETEWKELYKNYDLTLKK